jgi:hypothetical protein
VSAQDFIQSLTNPELNRLVALFMGAEPYREGSCVVWPDYAGSWEMAGLVFEILLDEEMAIMDRNGIALPRYCRMDGPSREVSIAQAAAYLAAQEMPDGYILDIESDGYHSDDLFWLGDSASAKGATRIGKHNSIEDAKVACWRHWLDIEMARGVVESSR